MDDVPMRRVPQQSRSQQTVDLILDTAADLFAEVGYESATTNAIAERAEISIGSLYRYFVNKDAILRALAKRHYEQVRALYDEVFTEDLIYLPLPVVLDRLIDPIVDLHTSCGAYKHILLGSDVSSGLAAAAEEIDREIVGRMASFLQVAAPHLDEQRACLVALLCKAEVKALLSLMTPSSGEEFRAHLTVEVKRMLLAYLEPILAEGEGTP